ncbi:MAG: glycosyltransferase family 4 protein [Flavobacteriales bacterium]
MRIGINTRSLLGSKMEGFGNYTLELVSRICASQPAHQFILYFDRPINPKYKFGSNVTTKVVYPPTRHPILYVIWFQWRLKNVIQKDQIDVFWSPDGMLPLGLTIPTLSSIHDLNFEHFPKDLPRWVSKYYRYYFPKFAQQATKIITVSQTTKEDIIACYSVPSDKIAVIYNGVNQAYQPLSSDEKIYFMQDQDFPESYFLFVGSLHPRKNIQRLLEAYQQFAATNSDTALVIVGSAMWDTQQFEIQADLKKRIYFLGHVDTQKLALIMAAATAFIYIPYFEGFGMPLAEAMASETPILAGNKSCLPEIAADAAYYVDPFDISDIANGMQKIKNDVDLQTELKKKGLERVKAFNWDHAATLVWHEITKLVS